MGQQVTVPSNLSQEEKLTFLLNIYHLLWLHSIVSSCREDADWQRWENLSNNLERTEQNRIKELQEKHSYDIGGTNYTLVKLEKLILPTKDSSSVESPLLLKNEPRVHFAINWTCIGCPGIRVFTVEHVFDQLEQATRGYLQDFISIDGKKVIE
jgi:hypothetical protein